MSQSRDHTYSGWRLTMHQVPRNGARTFHPFLAALLVAIMLLLVGCSTTNETGTPPTPTLAGLSVPDLPPKGGSDVEPTLSTLPQNTSAVPYAPTVSPPDATQVAMAAETAWTERATETAERTTVPVPIQTNEATVEPQSATMDMAWGPTPHQVQLPYTVDNDSIFLFHSVDPDGRFVVGAIVSRVLGSVAPARLVLVDAGDGHISEIASYVGPSASDIAGAPQYGPVFTSDTDGKTVVWNEQSAVRAYNISSGATTTLLEVPTQQVKLSSPDDVNHRILQGSPSFRAPHVDHGIAIWQDNRYILNSPVNPARILKADIATGEVTEISSFGAEAVVSWPYAAWIEYPISGQGANSLTYYHKGVITLLNLETGQKSSLGDIVDPLTFGLSADTIIYSRTTGQVFLTDVSGTPSRLISGSDRAYRFVYLNDRLATWWTEPPVSYDRTLDRRVYLALPTLTLSNGRVIKGHIMAWQVGHTFIDLEGQQPGALLPNDQLVYLIDTNTLPR